VEPATILVVDDSRLVRELIRDSFVEAGYSVATAAGAEEALARLGEALPDLILSDVAMPGMDGWALCEAVKSDPRYAEIPFVFLSGHREVPERLRGLRLGAYDYLLKPFSVEELLVRVRLILDRTGLPGAPKPEPKPGLSGHTSHLAVADLIQLLSVNGKTGTLTLVAEQSGRVQLREGRIVGATAGSASGRKALYRLVGWTDAEFRFEPQDDPDAADDLGPSVQRLVMDALVGLDDLSRLKQELPASSRPFAVSDGVRALLADPAALSPVEFAILREAREHASLDAMLERVDAPDVEIVRTVADLLDRGAIAPVAEGGARGA